LEIDIYFLSMDEYVHFLNLLHQYLEGNLSKEAHAEFLRLVATGNYDELLTDSIEGDLADRENKTPAEIPPHIAHEIARNIFQSEKEIARIIPIKQKMIPLYKWAIAVCAIIILAIGSLYLTGGHILTKISFLHYNQETDSFCRNESSSQIREIQLPDGSVVTLNPKSTLHFLKGFSGDTRDVYLEGSAFFNIAKVPQRPFLVYYKDIITKVVGTSFSVNTNAETGLVEVAVKTGKVQVFENPQLSSSAKNNAVIVTPNQKVIVDAPRHHMETALVELPLPIDKSDLNNPDPGKLDFDQVKLSDVFKKMGALYGIEIEVENERIYNCEFTGDLSGLDLFTAMKSICIATNSSYEINGTRILIKGKGCN
jgi:transmembrane sensor